MGYYVGCNQIENATNWLSCDVSATADEAEMGDCRQKMVPPVDNYLHCNAIQQILPIQI